MVPRRFPEHGFVPPNQNRLICVMEHKSQLTRKTGKSCGLTFLWYFVLLCTGSGMRCLNLCNKTNKNMNGEKQTNSKKLKVVKAIKFRCRRLFVCLWKPNPTFCWPAQLFVYMGNEDGLSHCREERAELGWDEGRRASPFSFLHPQLKAEPGNGEIYLTEGWEIALALFPDCWIYNYSDNTYTTSF